MEDYWRLVESTISLIDDLRGTSSNDTQPRLAEASKRWAEIEALVLQDGSSIPIDASFIVAHLAETPPNLEDLTGILGALLAERDNWSQENFTPADVDKLAPILARPEFQWEPEEPSPLQKFWLNLIDRIQDLIIRLFGDRQVQINLPFMQYAFVILGLIVIIFMLVYVFSGISRTLITEANLGSQAILKGEDLTAEAALRLAQELAASSDLRQAMRYLYLSSLLLLEERQLLRYDRSKTNREYLRSVAGHPELADVLKEVVDVFERVWYGYQMPDRSTFETYRNRIADLRQQK